MAQRQPNSEHDDLYELLQVSPNADLEVIEAAYRVLARRYHPDINRSPDATNTMARLNAAWEALRDPDRRTAYDRTRDDAAAAAPAGWAARVAEERRRAEGGPALTVEPRRLLVGQLRQGASRSFALFVQTEPPGIRVTTAIGAGAAWLAVAPAVLKGLEKEEVVVDLHARGLRPGLHRGTVEISTSWDTFELPVEVQVTRAPVLYRIGGAARARATRPLGLAIVLLLIVLALVFLAVR